MTLPSWLAIALITVSAPAAGEVPQQPLSSLPATGVGDDAPPPAVLGKFDELLTDALKRAGASRPVAPPSPDAAHVDQARAAWYDLRMPDALAHARAAIEHLRAHPEHVRTGDTLLMAHVYAALAAHELGKPADASAHFDAALTLRPDFRLSESEFSPTVLSQVERARERLLQTRARAPLTVSSSPGFAQITLDGRPAGDTPTTLREVLAGEHVVQLTKEGYLSVAQWVRVGPEGASVSAELPMSPVALLERQVRERIVAGESEALLSAARALALEEKADVVLVAGARAQSRWAVVVARVPPEGAPTRAHTTVALDLADAPAAFSALAKALLDASAGDDPVSVGTAAPPGTLQFGRHLLGLGPPPLPAVRVDPTPPVPTAPPTLWKRPVFWMVAGGVALAAAGTSTYLLTRPPERRPGAVVTVNLPQ